jgi:UDP-glucose 4-epimerase
MCVELTGRKVEETTDPTTQSVDVPFYVTDNALVQETLAWRPKHSARNIMEDVYRWVRQSEADLTRLYAVDTHVKKAA